MTTPGGPPIRASSRGRNSTSSSTGEDRTGGRSAIRKGSRIAILVFGEHVAGYANYGRNRARSLYYDGEIYELYLRPEFQGLGFGRKLFSAARKDLAQSGLHSLVVWALSDNETAVDFYRNLGGRAVARSSERFGTKVLDKVAFAWQS